jgi:hypothetical protein
MEQRYNIYFAGQLLEGRAEQEVRQNLGRLFNAGEATLEKLFSGSPQLLKRDCDRATALQYKQAMQRAGAQPVIKRLPDAESVAPSAKPVSTADRIAALVAAAPAPDATVTAAVGPDAAATRRAPASGTPTGGIELAPEGTEVLCAGERRAFQPREVDTSALTLDMPGALLEQRTHSAPPAPDTSHLLLASDDAPIPHLPQAGTQPPPDTSGIELSEAGTDFSDCQAPETAPLDLDLSALELGSEGEPLLRPEDRPRVQPLSPNTDHLKLT